MNADLMPDVADAIRQVLRRDDVVVERDSTLEELGIESLDMVELMFFLEEKFGIEIPYNANDTADDARLATAGAIAAALSPLVAATPHAAAA